MSVVVTFCLSNLGKVSLIIVNAISIHFWHIDISNSNLQYTAIKPLGDRVLVKIKTSEEKTDGGILLPTTAQTKPQGGEVVAVGEGKTIGKAKVDLSVEVTILLIIPLSYNVCV